MQIIMSKSDDEHMVANLAKIMALMCVRNTKLEDIHAGVVPVSKNGDYSDVMVVDAEGREIPWADVSHFDDVAMRDLMRQIVNRLYTFQLKAEDPHFQEIMDRWATVAGKWDEPELDEAFLKAIEHYREPEDREE